MSANRNTRQPSAIFRALAGILLLPAAAAVGSVTNQLPQVSAPAGFVRYSVPSNAQTLVSCPFTPFAPSLNGLLAGQLTGAATPAAADAVTIWDASVQSFTNAYKAANTGDPAKDGVWFTSFDTWTPAAFSFGPGSAAWVHNAQNCTQDVYLTGQVVSEPTRATTLVQGLSLFGYPFSGRRSLNATHLAADGAHGATTPEAADRVAAVTSADQPWLLDDPASPDHRTWLDLNAAPSDFDLLLGAGYWYWHVPAEPLQWSEPRPYDAPFANSASNTCPRIVAVTPTPATQGVTLTILSAATNAAGGLIDIYCQDLAPEATFNPLAWRAARLALPVAAGVATNLWTDDGTATGIAPAGIYSRVYLVVDANADADGDNLPDLRETYLCGTNPQNADTDGDGTDDGAEVAGGFNPLVPDLTGLPLQGMRLWLKGATLGLAAGEPVAVWQDVRSGGPALIQSDFDRCPQVTALTPNGRPAVAFDGEDDYLGGQLGPVAEPLTLLAVVRFDLLHQADGDYDYVFRMGQGGTAGQHLSLSRGCIDDTTADAYYTWDGAESREGPLLPGQKWLLVEVVFDHRAGCHRVYLNGVAHPAADFAGPLTLDGAIELGRFANNGFASHYLTGAIAELLVYERSLSETERTRLETRLLAEYALNEPPVVSAGPDIAIIEGQPATVTATISDDGLPRAPGTLTATLTATWTQLAGPAPVTITPATFCYTNGSSALRTPSSALHFPAPGAYRLRLTASDGAATSSDEIEVAVALAISTNVPAAGLALWLKADEIAAAPGTPVSVWPDRSGHGSDVSQSAAGRMPVWNTDGPDGRAALHFDGADDFLAGSVDAFGAPVTVITVARFDLAHQPAGDYDYILRLGDGGVPGGHLSFSRWADDPFDGDRYYTWAGGDEGACAGPELEGGRWYVLAAGHADTQPYHTLALDGTPVPVEDYSLPLALNGAIELGRFSQGAYDSHYLKGAVAEVLVYNRVLSAAERAAVDHYLKTKYALNAAPTVSAGPDLRIPEGQPATVTATVADDGFPATPGTLTATWTQLAGPAPVAFSPGSSEVRHPTSDLGLLTSVSFSAPGAYRLRLTASDGALAASDDIEVIVAASASSLMPTNGLRLWVKSDELAYNHNDPVSLWPDRSGRSHDLAQASAALRPLYVTNAVNGLPAVRFDGVNDALAGALGALDAPFTLVAVSRFALANQPAGNFDYLLHIGDGNTPYGHVSVSRLSADYVAGRGNSYYAWLGNNATIPLGPALPGNAWQILGVTHGTNAPRHRVTLDGAAVTVDDYTQSLHLDGAFELGRYSQGSTAAHHLAGDLAEVLVYDRVLTPDEATRLDRLLKDRYGLNAAPVVNAGPDTNIWQSAVHPAATAVTLAATVTDDGVPLNPGTLTATWTQLSGPAPVLLPPPTSDIGLRTSDFLFPAPGAYVLRLTACDGQLTASDDVTITVRPAAAAAVPTIGLRLWLRADEVAGDPGDPVALWPDASPRASGLTQPAAASRPRLMQDEDRGFRTVAFDGTNDFLSGALGPLRSPLTVVTVSRFDRELQLPGDYDYICRIGAGSVPYSQVSISRWAADPINGNRYYAWLGADADIPAGPVLPGGRWQLLLAAHATNAPRHSVTLDGYPTVAADYAQSLVTDGAIELGRYAQGGTAAHHLAGGIAELLVYDRLLAPAELLTLEGYLTGAYSLWTHAVDADGDGMGDDEERLIGRDPFVADDYAGLPFVEPFEPSAVVTGSLNGQHGWEATPGAGAIVQTGTVWRGRQALRLQASAAGVESVTAGHVFASRGAARVWTDLHMRTDAAAAPAGAPVQSAILFFNSSSNLVVYDGHQLGGATWTELRASHTLVTGAWARVSVRLNYATHEYLVCLNGFIVADHLGFAQANRSFTALKFVSGVGHVDDTVISVSQPAGLSLDWDSLPDDWEMLHFGTTAYGDNDDPDHDGLSNLQEFRLGTNPANRDTDGDGMPDGLEVAGNLNPLDPADGNLDADGDGLPNGRECALGTDPANRDTDGDGLSDGWEVAHGLNPLSRDSDRDGMSDGVELHWGYDPALSNAYFRIDIGVTTNTWATSFEPAEGYVTGPLHGQRNWNASNRVEVVAGTSHTGTQSVRVPAAEATNEPSQAMLGNIGAEGRDSVWVTFYQRGGLGEPQCDTNAIRAAAAYLTSTGVCAWDGATRSWKTSTRPYVFASNAWVRLDICLDYASKTYLVCADGLLALRGLRFADTNLTCLAGVVIKGAAASKTPGEEGPSSYVDDIRLSAVEPAGFDFDGDGLFNTEEYALGTDAYLADTDGDCLSDFDEVRTHGTNPLVATPDLDGDGLPNSDEQTIYGTDMTAADSDHDGIPDRTVVATAVGTATLRRSGTWVEQGTALRGTGTSAMRVEYTLTPPTNGMYQLVFTLANGDTANPFAVPFRMQLLIDGTPIMWLTPSLGTQPTDVTLTTPWLTTGPHTFRLAWLDQCYAARDLTIHALRLEAIDAPDANHDTIPDWAYTRLAASGDTDGDRLSDVTEISTLPPSTLHPEPRTLNPLAPDTDGDLLTDGDERLTFGTNPFLTDSDADTTPDAVAIASRLGVETAARYVSHITTDFTDSGDFIIWADSTASSCAYDLEAVTNGIHLLEVSLRNWQADPPDDYVFEFRVSLNAREFGTVRIRADVDRSGTAYIATPWLTPGTHRFKLAWANRVIQTGRSARPAIERVRLLAVDAADANADGIQDWMKASLLAGTTDADGDGIKDRDEVLVDHTDPTRADTDGDGLTDNEEKAAGTNPTLADTDGDGLSDYQELRGTGTNPLSADFSGVWNPLATRDGSAYVASAGDWHRDITNALAFGRGWVEYDIDLPKTGVCVMRVDATHDWWSTSCNAAAPLDTSDFLIHVDGQFVGRFTLESAVGANGALYALLPYLQAGPHRVRIFWNAVDVSLNLRLRKVVLGDFGGTDADGDGVPDWIRDSADRNNGVDRAPATSFVSPACLEGFARYPGFASARSGANNVAVQAGVSGRWYADLPLDETGAPTPLAVAFENGVCTSAVAVAWTPLDLLTAADQVLRVGDTLMLTVQTPAGMTGGAAAVVFDDAPPLEFPPGQPVTRRFDAPGRYLVYGTWTGDDGTPATRTVAVTVMAAPLPAANPACLLGRQRVWTCPDVTPGVTLQADSGVQLAWNGTNATLTVNRMYAEHVIVARAGANGPILDSRRIDHFWIQAAVDSFFKVIELRPTSQVWENRLVGLNIPDSVSVELHIFVGGVTFDDLTITRWLTAADIGGAGDYRFRMFHPNSVGSSTCHTIKAYQNGVFIGEAYFALAGLPVDMR